MNVLKFARIGLILVFILFSCINQKDIDQDKAGEKQSSEKYSDHNEFDVKIKKGRTLHGSIFEIHLTLPTYQKGLSSVDIDTRYKDSESNKWLPLKSKDKMRFPDRSVSTGVILKRRANIIKKKGTKVKKVIYFLTEMDSHQKILLENDYKLTVTFRPKKGAKTFKTVIYK